MLNQTENCLQIPKWCPYEERKEVSVPTDNQDRLHQAKAVAMCMACHDYVHPPPVPPFFLGQNLSSKWIVPTDNMRPKSDDAKKRHWYLKS